MSKVIPVPQYLSWPQPHLISVLFHHHFTCPERTLLESHLILLVIFSSFLIIQIYIYTKLEEDLFSVS